MLPRDVSQQIFDELVYSQRLNDVILQAFRDCALQVVELPFVEVGIAAVIFVFWVLGSLADLRASILYLAGFEFGGIPRIQ